MKGIDVSKYQKQIEWGEVSGINFALIRIGMGNDIKQIDPYFKANVEQALAHGLYVGGYILAMQRPLRTRRKKLIYVISFYNHTRANCFIR